MPTEGPELGRLMSLLRENVRQRRVTASGPLRAANPDHSRAPHLGPLQTRATQLLCSPASADGPHVEAGTGVLPAITKLR